MVSAKAGESAASAGRSPAQSRAFHPFECNVFIGFDSSDARIEDLPRLGHLRNPRPMGGTRDKPMAAMLHDGKDVGLLVSVYWRFWPKKGRRREMGNGANALIALRAEFIGPTGFSPATFGV